MASIQPRSGKFRVGVCKNGVRESATQPTRREAIEWGKRREVEIQDEATRVRTRLTLAEAILRELPERTDQREVNTLKRLARSMPCADKPIRKIEPGDLQAWVKLRQAAGVKNSTINRELNTLAGVFVRWLADSPLRQVKRPENPPSRVRRVSDDEIRRVREALAGSTDGVTLTNAFLLAIETGMRQGEILGMTWAHVDLAARTVHLPETKNGDPRDVALSPRAVELLSTTNGDTDRCFPLTSRRADYLWRRKCGKAGLVNLHFHDSRHEACTRLARRLPVHDLARMLGWRDINSLMIYYNPTASEIAELLD